MRNRKWIGFVVVGLIILAFLMLCAVSTDAATTTILDFTPTAYAYLPAILRQPTPTPVCPTTSDNAYSGGIVFQYELDDPVRPASEHADKNLEVRSYTLNTDPNLRRELIDYGVGDPAPPPQFATLFDPYRVPELRSFYQVYNWTWAVSPDPGSRGAPIENPPVTALGLGTVPGEEIQVPTSGYDIGGGMEVVVLYADEDTVALRYTREDSSGSPGYTVHIDNICVDPNLLSLYEALDDPDGPRYVYVPPNSRPYGYDLPNLPAGKVIGVAKEEEIVVAIVDTGVFLDPRSCNDWWQLRPGYGGSCPPARAATLRISETNK
ncbi:MAG: hypothetical protein PVI59_15885 [Anaerolineae bacterium]